MLRLGALALVLTCAACSGRSASVGAADDGDDAAAAGQASSPSCAPALRCAADPGGPTAALAVCGTLQGDNALDVGGAVRVAGDWVVHAATRVRGDVFVGGALSTDSALTVDGTLHASSTGGSKVVTAGGVDELAGPPLDCASAPDVGKMVASASQRIASGASGAALPASAPAGCNAYRFDALEVDDALVFRVDGAASIVVDGTLKIAAPVRIELAAGASLDLAIGGDLEIDDTFEVTGGPAWIGVAGRVHVGDTTSIDGWLVAPDAEVAADNRLDVTGAMIAGRLHVAAPMTVHAGAVLAPNGCIGR